MALFRLDSMYPNFARIVNADLPKVPNDTRKFKAFKKFGNFSDKEARQVLRARSPKPIVTVSRESPIKDPSSKRKYLSANTFGHYPESGNIVYINIVLVEQYEWLHRSWQNSPSFSRPGWLNYSRRKRRFTAPHIDEEINNWKYTIEQARLKLEAVILHEIVHWGERYDPIPKYKLKAAGWKDIGHLFVYEAYGKKIDLIQATYKENDMEVNGWLGWDENKQPY